MNVKFKIGRPLLRTVIADLWRKHEFAHERVGFVTMGATLLGSNRLVLIAQEYKTVEDRDYLRNNRVGAMIGPDAIRKGLQFAYKNQSALFHIHTHGLNGKPHFSSVDRLDAHNFVPSFFNAVPSMPHGIIVLSDTHARALVWLAADTSPIQIDEFAFIGSPLTKFGAEYDTV